MVRHQEELANSRDADEPEFIGAPGTPGGNAAFTRAANRCAISAGIL